MLLGTWAQAGIHEDFEGYSVGDSPTGIWSDAASYITNPTNPGPTVSVIGTTDAHGNATQAMQINDGIGTSGGIIGQVESSRVQRFSTDLRLDQRGNGSSPNWIAASGFIQETDQTDFNWMPQAFIYATSNSSRFRLYVRNADGQSGAARDFGLGNATWSLNTWYRLQLEVDTETGVFQATVVDLESGVELINATRTYAGWNSEFGQYDAISVNDGEYGANPGTIGNMATIDNIGHVPAPGTGALIGLGLLGASRRRR